MGDAFPITEARAKLGSLVRRVAQARECITITDHGRPVAVVIHPQELAALEDDLALALYRSRRASGTTVTLAHRDVCTRLGLDRERGAGPTADVTDADVRHYRPAPGQPA
ncbi:type II toxin-antitoxin system Phd/YefM family antitoxin [Streptomyces goshikiensis]